MEWPKLKNIILLILVAVNLFLAVLVGVQEGRKTRLVEQVRRDAVRVLEQNGISIDPAVLPEDAGLQSVRIERDREQERQMAQTLFEAVTEESQGGASQYTGPTGTLRVSNNGIDFSATFVANALPLDGQTPAQHALALMTALDIDAQVLREEEEQGVARVWLCQRWQGAPVTSCVAVLRYERGCLVAIEEGSRRLPGAQGTATGDEMMTAVTALIRFWEGINHLGDLSSKEIQSITAGYTLSSSLTGPSQLVPVWFFVTDTRNYSLDGLTGALSRAD